ncbi:hypothetical protein KSP39_PZI006650 [Platanthera zijinensis]|uniref:phosphoribosylformylglycinamidine cyclo-ligase n=1 Tax=Platanthera zijinensis TaxID=2320716 RepID=A0AAP0BQR1_9ASPA
MAPTVIYVKQVLDIISKGGVKGIAHITGGGFTDNIPRVFPPGLGAKIFTNSWHVPAVFKWLQEAGNIDDTEMRRTFNMGIGLVAVVAPEAAERILAESDSVYRIGVVVDGEGVEHVLDIISKGGVKGIAHITGGGFTDNIPRVFPPGLGAKIFTNSWHVPAVFKWLQEAGNIDDTEMRRTFNMGIGLVAVVAPEAAERILAESDSVYRIGVVVDGEGVEHVSPAPDHGLFSFTPS